MEKTKKRSAKRVRTVSKLAAVKNTVKKIVTPAASSSKMKNGISADELQLRIQDKAHDLFLSRGCSHGDDQADWYEAERLVKAELGLSGTGTR